MKSGSKQKKGISKMINILCRQQALTRTAMQQSYQRQMWEYSKDEMQRIVITPVNLYDDLYVVSLSLHFKGIAVNSESWIATYSWASRRLMELGGQQRSCCFDTQSGCLYLEVGQTFPLQLLTFKVWKR